MIDSDLCFPHPQMQRNMPYQRSLSFPSGVNEIGDVHANSVSAIVTVTDTEGAIRTLERADVYSAASSAASSAAWNHRRSLELRVQV
jgi:hypothetical protein